MKWIVFCLLAQPVLAACPANPDHDAAYASIFGELRSTPSEARAGTLSARLWDLWLRAPDDTAQRLLDRGILQIRSQDLMGARASFSELIAYCPDYAEGWNQRAFAAYLSGDLPPALDDLDTALALNPTHLGALTGKGLTLLGLGRNETGQSVLREAVRLNPWLRERELITGPLEQDI